MVSALYKLAVPSLFLHGQLVARNQSRMSLHKEIQLEDEICEHLAANGWRYDAGGDEGYDRQLALFPDDVLAWVQQTQPDAWEALTKNHGASAGATLLQRIRDSLDRSGTLHVLRNGIDVLGMKQKLRLAQFKPALAMNPDIVARYDANRLRVVRQVHYSPHNQNSLDLVLFLNGIPVATAELKTDFTQSIGDAIDQYRFDRLPNPKGKSPEPLLSFPSGALVHFAVSSSEAWMTTRLAGPTVVLDLRTKLDEYGFYDEHEIERVVAVELDPNAKQKQLDAAIAPVADRLLKQYSKAAAAAREAEAAGDEKAAQEAKDQVNALLMFRTDIGTYQRVYTFLSQIFDYGNTDFEKRSIFFKYLVRLLKFGRERDDVDLSQVVLTHHTLRNKGKQKMGLESDTYPELQPISEAGTGLVREKKKAYLQEIIEKVNDLFQGELTDNDKGATGRPIER